MDMKRTVIPHLHDTGMNFRAGMKISPRHKNRGELAPVWLAPAWHFVLVSCKRIQSHKREPEWIRAGMKVAPISWALTIRPKISTFSKRGQMVRKIPGKSFRKSGNCWISEKRTIQPKIPEIPGWKSNGTEISREKFSKIWVYLTRLSSFSEFMQIPNFLLSAS